MEREHLVQDAAQLIECYPDIDVREVRMPMAVWGQWLQRRAVARALLPRIAQETLVAGQR